MTRTRCRIVPTLAVEARLSTARLLPITICSSDPGLEPGRSQTEIQTATLTRLRPRTSRRVSAWSVNWLSVIPLHDPNVPGTSRLMVSRSLG